MVLASQNGGGARVTGERVIDVAGLPDFEISSRAPLFSGQLLMCAIEGSLFAILIAMYLYLRLGVDVWPPPGVHVPKPLVSTLALLPLFASCIGSYLSSEAAKRNDRRGMVRGMAINLAFGGLFLLLRAWEW